MKISTVSFEIFQSVIRSCICEKWFYWRTLLWVFPHDLKILSLASKFKNIKRLFKQNVSLTFSFTLSCTTSAITAFVRELKVSVELLASEKNPNTTTLINLIFLCCNPLLRWNSLFIPYIVYLLVLIPWIMYKKTQEIKKVTKKISS